MNDFVPQPVVALTRRTRPRPVGLLVLLAALVAGLLGGAGSAPASAQKPEGSKVELIFALDSDFTRSVPSGTFTTRMWGVPSAANYSPRANGCGNNSVAFAFVPGSADPSALGSAERPAVAAGQTVQDLFEWPAPDSPGDSLAYQYDPRNEIGPADDLVRLDERWSDGTFLSVVAVCFKGTSVDPARQQVMAGTDGFAITSWIQFTTVAAPGNPAKGSAGFVVGARRETPLVALTGAPSPAGYRLRASVTDTAGAPLRTATGRIDYAAGVGSDRRVVASAPVGSDATASVDVALPPAGEQTVYDATYVPDAAAAGTYGSATSRRYAVVGPPTQLSATVAITAAPTTYGTAAQTSVTVRRNGAIATGEVAVGLDGRALRSLVLVNGRATIELPDDLPAGTHTLDASYAGNSSTGPGAATTTLSVAKADSEVTAEVKRTKPKPKKGKPRKPPRTKVVVVLTAPDTTLRPGGSVTISVKGKTIATGEVAADGTVTVRLPDSGTRKAGARGKAKKVTATVAYRGDANFTAAETTVELKIRKGRRS